MEPEPRADVPELIPRNYQADLIRICVKQNSIIFLPTGAGKTFIAVCALKELAMDDFVKSYCEGGKICVFIVNTVTLVHQHCKYMQQNTPFTIGAYTGDMNLDFWSKERWLEEYDSHHVVIMTAQIFKNSLQGAFIDLNQVNVLIFDECHHGVDSHPMREIMFYFNSLANPPRVIGLTATLLNGNVKPLNVREKVKELETTFHSKVATVDALINVIGFSTNPQEDIVHYRTCPPSAVLKKAIAQCNALENIIRLFKVSPTKQTSKSPTISMPYLKKEKPFEKFYKLLMDAQLHFEMLGIPGARIACILYTIHMELEKRNCADIKTLQVINSIISLFADIRINLEPIYYAQPKHLRTILLSTNKVQQFIKILTTFKSKSKQDLCGIVFVERKNTAVFLYHLLNDLRETYDGLEYIKPDFIIGSNANPLNCTTESLYYAKLNKKIIDKFNAKEVNLLIASNVIEEGVDVPMCTLVVKFDVVKDYRAYVQSKGRARHADSLYYIMVESCGEQQFYSQYQTFQQIERNLNDYLIGANEIRQTPDREAIEELYTETKVFYVDGPGSANVTESAAVQLLMMYCGSAKTDAYTIYEPICYLQECQSGDPPQYQVYIEMPLFCPIKEIVCGDMKDTKREAKRSAAFNACIKLYDAGEMTTEMTPRVRQINPESIEYLFTHWPERRQKNDGVSRIKRSYTKVVSKWMSEPIVCGKQVYLHIIDMKPAFENDQYAMAKMYSNEMCYGLISAVEFPNLCEFPTFITLGKVPVRLCVNQNVSVLSRQDLIDIKSFHHLVFNDVLDIAPSYLMLGDNNTQYAYVVPVLKSAKAIDFDTIRRYRTVADLYTELSVDEKSRLIVNDETYLEKIVTPYYRADRRHHLVLGVSYDLTASSPFPSEDYDSYAAYYESKYDRLVVSPNLPMLLVKPLSANLNCLRPKGAAAKRKREETYETLVQHFIPELCIKQEFPAPLWVCATLLPSVLHRIEHLLRAEELRSTIAAEANLGAVHVEHWKPLKVDKRLIKYKTDELDLLDENKDKEDEQVNEDLPHEMKPEEIAKMISSKSFNKEFYDIMNDTEYPWDSDKEPLEHYFRNLDITLLDIQLYSKFIKTDYNTSNNNNGPSSSRQHVPPGQRGMLAINYKVDYAYKPIILLTQKGNKNGPELSAVYEALSAAKSNEIVNLERMETLGDSFLKMVASLYIFVKFPHYSEGEATELKGRLISNKNLFYLANLKRIGGLLKMADLNAKDEWLPFGYCAPIEAHTLIESKAMLIESLFNIQISKNEQVAGCLLSDTLAMIESERSSVEEGESLENSYSSMCHYLGIQLIGDKTLADVVEAVIGVYVESMGIEGGLKIIEWLGIIPDDLHGSIFNVPVPSPIVKENYVAADLRMHLSNFEANAIEDILDYKFNNRAFLLQALTHSSYSSNRLTCSYQRLEFIGDAVLDLLITLFIYENNTSLNPGDLTDLRSALVNNETFAAYVIKLGLHKYLKHYNEKLRSLIAKFENYQALRENQITSDVLILLNEDHLRIAENVDVPKVLGDLFESIIGAIFLDSGKNLNTVWRVIHKIMWQEIESFSKEIPKNPIRMLYENLAPLRPNFSEPYELKCGTVMMKLDFVFNGTLTRVHGFGDNKTNSKKAAAKIALRLLSVKHK